MVQLSRFIVFIFLIFLPFVSFAKVVKYSFDIDKLMVNYTGKNVEAIAVSNKIPAPTISATVGDTLVVTFHNKMNEDSSIHWHGILLPNDQDGVPYLTTQPIKANSSFTYKFKVTHSGTYWYHSHTGLQEQRGVYGAIVFHPKSKITTEADHDYVLVLSDWTNENPNKVIANLKKDGDYYALKKGSVQSWDKVFQYGHQAIKNRLHGSWTRMGPMDLSDVGYDAFLANGKQVEILKASKGDTVKLRIINAAASSYFNLEFADGDMKIIAADGVDIEPIKAKRLRIAIAETYDIIVKVPDNNAYELRATSEDGTGYSSTFIGTGNNIAAPTIARPNLFLVDHSMHSNHKNNMHEHKAHHNKAKHIGHHGHHNTPVPTIAYMDNYDNVRATINTELPKKASTRKILLNLTGNMERYVWSFNNKTLLESDKILIKKGENVKLILNNKTMMHHPIHLHGHFFRVLNGQGKKSPLKHTVNVPAMETVEIEFAATEDKDWFFHCHNLYHMKSGMARVISYQDSTTANKETFNKIASDPWYFASDISLISNMSDGVIRASNTRNAFNFEYDYNYKKEYEAEITYERSLTRFLDIYAGINFERENKDEKSENKLIAGIHYVLPMLIESKLELDSKGKAKIGLGSDLQLTERGKFTWGVNTDKEYRLSVSYELSKNVLITSTYDSDFKFGLGLRFRM